MNEAAIPGAGERLGHIQTDRPCVGCGFNLFGLPITRDEHYGMPIARCAECGQVVALQEYPGLGVWASRWSSMIAAIWLLAVLALFAFTLTMATTPVGATLGEQCSEIGNRLALIQQQEMNASNPNFTSGTPSMWSNVSVDWAKDKDLAALVKNDGPVYRQLDSSLPFTLAVLWIMIYATSLPWAVVLLRMSRVKIAAYLCLVIAMGGVLVSLSYSVRIENANWIRDLAIGVAWPYLVGIAYPILFTAGIAAAYTGRPLARLVIRAALPPRLRLPFAPLWRADGKEVAAVTGR